MIVPEFKLKQTDSHVVVFIRVPYIKVTACEFYIEADTFKFYLKPYLLSLTFQQPLREVEEPSKAIYYHEKYTLEVHLEKAQLGQFFQNLDLLANILNNKKPKKKGKVSVEVVGETATGVLQEEESKPTNQYNYGFSMNYSNVLDNLDEETSELFEFDPKSIPLNQRHRLSTDILIKQFDYQSYLFDKYDNEEEIVGLIGLKGHMSWVEDRVKEHAEGGINSVEFKLKMKGKQLLISKTTKENIFKELLSIMFSYVYELICMGGQISPESARTINRTSLIFSCSSYYGDVPLKDVVIDCCKRCLTYSLYKSLKICRETLSYLNAIMDVLYIRVALLDIKQFFDRSQPRYLLNQLFVDDYLIYLYSLQNTPQSWQELTKHLHGLNITEEDLGLGIADYENMGDDSDEDLQSEGEKKQRQELEVEFSRLNTLD